MTQRVLILIGGHFSLAPRAQKEAASASLAGFAVTVCGTWWDERLATEDLLLATSINVRFIAASDLRMKNLKTNWLKVKQRISKLLFSKFRITSPSVFGNSAIEMLRIARKLRPELTMVHSEAGLWVGKKLMESGYRVGVDFEDWFSEDLPSEDRVNRPIAALKKLEAFMLNNARPQFATTECMSHALQKFSGSHVAPVAIPNAFPWSSRPSTVSMCGPTQDVKFYWFSQTIGPNRGLENLALALEKNVGPWELHLLGNLRGYQNWFDRVFEKVRSNIHIHAPVSNQELPVKSAQFDVGLALEIPYCRNRDLTATNKLFEYFRCGLPVIATNTQGQCEVMSKCPNAGWIVPSNNVESLRSVIQSIIDQPAVLLGAKRAALFAAEHIWNWEQFEKRQMEEFILATSESQ